MPHKLEVSPSGRAKCATCKQTIPKGDLRFGESFASAFSEDGVRWHHTACAAKKLPYDLEATIAAHAGDIPDRAALEAAVVEAKKTVKPKPRGFPHADRAPTGRARCIGCQEGIEKGAFRVVVEREIEVGMGAQRSAGYLHPTCAKAWAEEHGQADGFADRIRANTVALGEGEIAEVAVDVEV